MMSSAMTPWGLKSTRHPPGPVDQRTFLLLRRIEHHGHLGPAARYERRQAAEQPVTLLLQRYFGPGRLGDVVAVHDHVHPREREQRVEHRRVVAPQRPVSRRSRHPLLPDVRLDRVSRGTFGHNR